MGKASKYFHTAQFSLRLASRDCFAAFPLAEVPVLDVGG